MIAHLSPRETCSKQNNVSVQLQRSLSVMMKEVHPMSNKNAPREIADQEKDQVMRNHLDQVMSLKKRCQAAKVNQVAMIAPRETVPKKIAPRKAVPKKNLK